MINTLEEAMDAEKYFVRKLNSLDDEEAWYSATAIELIEKEFPRPPKSTTVLSQIALTCPCCERLLPKVRCQTRCMNCGQVLDWTSLDTESKGE